MSGDAVEVPWRRLAPSVIWVDAAAAAVSLMPVAIAVVVVGAPLDSWAVWTTAAVAGTGVIGAAMDMWRWWKTRYRVTATHVEMRTGLAVRQHRSIRRDRIRSVDASARLRHRVAGLVVVSIGAGQQSSGEEAFALDAVDAATARWLRHELLDAAPVVVPGRETASGERVIATYDPRWIIHNVFSVWAFVLSAGLLWGAYWAVQPFGVNSPVLLERLITWNPFSPLVTAVLVVAAMGVFGVVGLAVHHVAEAWRFRLSRTGGDESTVLRTSQGLFSTREVNRDVARIRGVAIGEPLLWRFMGTTDTDLISTGLAGFTFQKAAGSTILPRTGRATAIRAAHAALGTGDAPLSARLRGHPRAALRRRLAWALAVSAGAVTAGIITPLWWAWIPGVAVAVASLGLAVASYLALGHTTAGAFLVVRSGGWYRSTSALRSDAIIGWSFRQSPFQRRLGLMSAMVSTSAGSGGYGLTDAASTEVVGFALEHSPDLLRPFLTDSNDPTS